MAQRKMAKKRQVVYISSSIRNWEEKLLKRTKLPLWNWQRLHSRAIFFGLYHPLDCFKFICHRGPKKVFWCGSDILNLEHSSFKRHVARAKAQHFCENWVEQEALKKLGIEAQITPMIFDDPKAFPLSFKPSKKPHVWLCAHEGREEEYGVDLVEKLARSFPLITFHIYGVYDRSGAHNVIYHGRVPEEQFNREIKKFQGALRLNTFDGMGEVLSKAILLGQYPCSYIGYPHFIPTTLNDYLKTLSLKKTAYPHRQKWLKIFNASLKTLLA